MDMNIRKYVLLLGVFIAAVSCSFEPPTIPHSTRIDIKVDPSSVKGTQAYMTFTPEDDRVYYTYDIISFAEYDEGIRKFGSEEAKVNAALKEMYDSYANDFREYYRDHAYIASFKNSQLNYGAATHLAVNLTPETDYYAIAFCVDCINDSTFRLNGEMFKEKFRTTEIRYDLSNMKLEYMLRDFDGRFYCYTKPTYFNVDLEHDGKICRDPYIVSMVSQSDLDREYGGNFFRYAREYYAMIAKSGHLSDFLRIDITREQYDMSEAGEDEYFYIVGAPFNITNLDLLYILKFQYRRNMDIRYTSETLIVFDTVS